jgi:hypothetical protein
MRELSSNTSHLRVSEFLGCDFYPGLVLVKHYVEHVHLLKRLSQISYQPSILLVFALVFKLEVPQLT